MWARTESQLCINPAVDAADGGCCCAAHPTQAVSMAAKEEPQPWLSPALGAAGGDAGVPGARDRGGGRRGCCGADPGGQGDAARLHGGRLPGGKPSRGVKRDFVGAAGQTREDCRLCESEHLDHAGPRGLSKAGCSGRGDNMARGALVLGALQPDTQAGAHSQRVV